MKFTITAEEIFGKALAGTIAELTGELSLQAEAAVKTVSKQAYEKIKEKAAGRLYRTKDQYLLAMKYEKVGNGVYAITLDSSAAHLEEGYESYDMKPGLLHLGKEIPKGADGKDKIKVSKAGYRYRAIPFDQNQSAAKPNHPLHNNIEGTFGPSMVDRLRSNTTGNTVKGTMNEFKAGGYGGLSKDSKGNMILGKVASARPNPNNRNSVFIKDATTGIERSHTVGSERHPNSMGATKYQYEVKNRNGGTTVKSAYVTFRIVSENPSQAGKWIHPGFKGIHAFQDVHRWAEDTLEKMLVDIIKDYN